MSCLDAYISRYGDFCAHDDNDDNDDNNDNDTTNYFTPCACVRGNNAHLCWGDVHEKHEAMDKTVGSSSILNQSIPLVTGGISITWGRQPWW